ncbi:MAG: hypothetical protein Pars2KO_11770 [Parasphingorhabdus sp.]
MPHAASINPIFSIFLYFSHVEKGRKSTLSIGLLVATMALSSAPLAAQCRLCGAPNEIEATKSILKKSEKPLRIEITANLDFSRLALIGRSGGEVSIDPVSGNRRVSGAVTDLGGMSLNGEGRLEGEPGRYVRINLPDRITLSAPNGSTAEVVTLETNLPPQAKLDREGRLIFTFGGTLRVTGNAGGQYRGRIAITADYE